MICRPYWATTNSPELIAAFAHIAQLEVAQVPAALAYLQAMIAVDKGEYQWVETHIRRDEDRFFLRPTKSVDLGVLYFVDRPARWDLVKEHQAYKAMRAVLEARGEEGG